MIPAFVFSATERRMWKKESLYVHRGFSALLQTRPATVRLNICRLFMDSIVELFVHCRIFQFTSKSSRLVLIVDSNPESIPFCLLSVRTRALSSVQLWFFLICLPALAAPVLELICGAHCGFPPSRCDGTLEKMHFLPSQFLCGLSFKGRTDRFQPLSACQEFTLVSCRNLCDL